MASLPAHEEAAQPREPGPRDPIAARPTPRDARGRPLFEPLLTVDDVAYWLGKPKNTLYAWRTRGVGPRAIKVGNDLRYRVEDVEAFIEANRDPARDPKDQ